MGSVSINLEKLDRHDGRNDNKLSGKKKAIAQKMARTLDSATSRNVSKYPKHGGQAAGKHGTGVSKGLPF